MRTWTVIRQWRNVRGDTVVDAIEASKVGEHDEVRVTPYNPRSGLAPFYFERPEIELLQTAVANAITQNKANLALVGPEGASVELLREHALMLNSLRTALAEARYGLMSVDEVHAERAARDDLEREGVEFLDS